MIVLIIVMVTLYHRMSKLGVFRLKELLLQTFSENEMMKAEREEEIILNWKEGKVDFFRKMFSCCMVNIIV